MTKQHHLDNGPDDDSNESFAAVARYVHEVGHLKRARRTGWWLAGIDDPESVADHVFRTAIVASILASLEGADPGRAALLAIFHDVVETRLGDVPSVGKKYTKTADDLSIADDQIRNMPKKAARLIRGAVDEYKKQATLEARLARDADRLECLAQAAEYSKSGYAGAEAWIDGSYAMLTSEAARQIGTSIRENSPEAWWRGFVEGYRGSAPPEKS